MLDMGKWLFYPVAAHVIESKYRRKKFIILKEVQRVAPSVQILQLRRAIDGVIEELSDENRTDRKGQKKRISGTS